MNTRKIVTVIVMSVFFFVKLTSAKAGEITFENYHSYKEVSKYVKALAVKNPGLVKFSSIGKSYLGKDIWMVEVSSRHGKKPADKPAVYIDGATHGDEVLGTEACLYFIRHLVQHYNTDKEVTLLLDTRVFYIVPVVNPDAADRFVTTPQVDLRNNLRPVDDDKDGRIDEDPPDDIDGNGVITMMRQEVADEGTVVQHPDDPRIMVKPDTKKGAKGKYKYWRFEGLDNDRDGKVNEDGIGGVDLNRNYPANWQAADKGSRGGLYPLSEPETKAVVDFCLAHPNIALALSNHAAGGVLYQPLLGDKPSHIPAGDKAVFKEMARVYKDVVGDDVLPGEKGMKPFLYGVFVDWAYQHLGAYSGIVDLRGLPDKYNPDKRKKQGEKESKDPYGKYLERMKLHQQFVDDVIKEEAFIPWKPFKHPTLGNIEIGGTTKMAWAPPPKLLEKILQRFTNVFLALAELTPLVKIKSVKIKPVQVAEAGENRKALLEVTVTVENQGPVRSTAEVTGKTSLPRRPKLSDLVILEPDKNVAILSEKPGMSIGYLAAKGKPGDCQTVSWLIRLKGNQGTVTVVSKALKGGIEKRVIRLSF
jgi:hypothetical protein